ncbi:MULTISPECIES: DUF6415 family natural product biosynthesis protein [unclassified Streptomyces]|uniref:DUF6415 family natural product biosynthesis protein n=1 Tax=unclassified Streptomyces TaxID=2593676 RepID=UPI00081E39AD|nr:MULTISPECIES: DUF6415 family natural product biosynthesis protein [unclassified Streptomyces]MYZ35588.1 hypothetical protein [Streptomyces sp. SID4917]SCF76707.1 hypothetical protein GA0115259_102274 [Streptomyces sp. MnatMP-M17]
MSAVKRVEGPVPSYSPSASNKVSGWMGPLAPLTIGLHHRLLAGLWPRLPTETPVLDGLYDALEAVLGEHADPNTADIDEADAQVRMMVPLLVDVASRQSRPAVTDVVASVENVAAEARPDDFPGARAQTRRLALAVLDLVDLLVEAGP